ncbi:NAD(P)H-binding protein [Hamadaea tsunoensis]|uniref:NAD(P)H-binding protein n=1 Tax=Hamadaea tsunoensis TaxID=53368 RepID=UPI000485E3F1|nr:NAD(P)H-binding protein [Hamadaea tsunoensis]
MTTLVIGARGSIGRHVLDQLLAAAVPVRASVRSLATAAELPPGTEVVAADLTRPETLPEALDGVRAVFVYALADGAEDFVRAAEKAGVEHVVLMSSGSVLLPWTQNNAIAREHREVEAVLAASALRCTPIRPLALANNALGWSWGIRDDGAVRMAYPEARTAPVHERDVAAFATEALLGRAGAAVSDLLTGGELLTQREQVAMIAAALGRPVRIEELSPEEGRASFARFMPAAQAAAVVEFLADAATGGSPATDTVVRVLGRPPLSFTRWITEHIADFQ